MSITCDWQTCMVKMTQRMSFSLKSGWMADVEFMVGEEGEQESIKAHKLILAMGSPVFEAMLFGGISEKSGPIRIPDVDPAAFHSLLKYMYTDELSLHTVESAVDLCYVARKYIMPHLVRECTQYIWKDVSERNVCKALEFARLFEVQFLVEKCLNVFMNHAQEVFQSDEWEDLPRSTVETLLSQDEMNIDCERVVFDNVLRWGRRECERAGDCDPSPSKIREVLGSVLGQVRLLAMTTSEFTSGPAMSGLFSDEEILSILMNISVPGVRPLPFPLSIQSSSSKRRQVQRKHMCALTYPIASKYIQAPATTELRLYVDKSVLLHGIQLTTQCLSPSSDPQYQEHIIIEVCNADGDPLEVTTFTKMVAWDERIEVALVRPYQVTRHSGFVLKVSFQTAGSYKCYTDLMGPFITEDVHLTCSFINGFIIAIDALIFSR